MMNPVIRALISSILATLKSRASLHTEILALRHQLAVYQRTHKRPRLKPTDRILWSWLSRFWSAWDEALVLVKPRTVIEWRKRKFREHWTNLTRSGKSGRPKISKEVCDLIRKMSVANPIWGTPRIIGELRKIGIQVSQATVDKYRIRRRKPPSPTWKAFLKNHVEDLVSIDFFVVPTVRFRILFVMIVLIHNRRRIVHFNVTEHPSQDWAAQQIVEAFPFVDPPKYMIRDRDRVYGQYFRRRVKNLGIEEVPTAPRSPWQSPYVEMVIGSIRRDCLDHVIVLSRSHLHRILNEYFGYYHQWRTHLSIDMDCRETRHVHSAHEGKVIEIPDVGGLHHHYIRRAA